MSGKKGCHARKDSCVRTIMKLGLFILASLVLFTSCLNRDCKKLDLSKEEMEWFENYENGDSVFFVNQFNEMDTFIVEVSSEVEYTTCNRFELGEYVYPLMSLRFQNVDDYRTQKGSNVFYLEFYKDIDNLDSINGKACQKAVYFFELTAQTFYAFEKLPHKNIIGPNTRDSIVAYEFTLNIEATNEPNIVHIMQQFAISKEYGLVSYKTLKGDVYQRIWDR